MVFYTLRLSEDPDTTGTVGIHSPFPPSSSLVVFFVSTKTCIPLIDANYSFQSLQNASQKLNKYVTELETKLDSLHKKK